LRINRHRHQDLPDLGRLKPSAAKTPSPPPGGDKEKTINFQKINDQANYLLTPGYSMHPLLSKILPDTTAACPVKEMENACYQKDSGK
jgi:hypothetical protein